MLTIIDEYTRECLSILAARRIRSDDVLHLLAALFADRGPPDHIRSDNGPEFTVKAVREWLRRIYVKTLFIKPETVNPERPDPAFVQWDYIRIRPSLRSPTD